MIYLWIIYCLILTLGILGVSLTSASRLSDFLVILLLLPLIPTLLSDFAKYRKKTRLRAKQALHFAASVPALNVSRGQDTSPETGLVLDPTISDTNRRLFLRLAGSSGLALFMLVIFGQKSAQAAFFGSVPGPGTVSLKNSSGTTIDPAEKLPTDGYTITEVDDSGTDSYYGFVDKTGAWYITKETSTGAYRYAKGSSGFSTAWGLRADPATTYDYFDNVF